MSGHESIAPWFSLENTTCIVAGAAGLLGANCTKALADCGAEVLSLDRDFKREIAGNEFQLDLCDEGAVKSFFRTLANRTFKDRNFAFINCSYPRTERWANLGFENVTLQDFTDNASLQLGSAFLFSQQAVGFMKGRGGGCIINFSSIYGLGGPDLRIYDGTSMQNPVPYAATKAGIIGLSRYIAAVYGPLNIRSNVIAPGGIQNGQPESFVQAYETRTPLRRLGKPEDIGGVVAFLAGPAAAYISGAVIPVDGGWTSW